MCIRDRRPDRPARGQQAIRQFSQPRGQHRLQPLSQRLGQPRRRPARADRDQHRIAVDDRGQGEIAQVWIVGRIDQHAARPQPLRRRRVAIRHDGDPRSAVLLAHDLRARPLQQAALGVGRLARPGQDHRPARQAQKDGQAVHQSASQSGMLSPAISASIGGRARTTAHLSPDTSTSGVSGRLL